jgi:TrmH family RNA methyltransferase
MLTITSTNNPRVKRVLGLQQKAKLRREAGLFVVEGMREVKRALSCGYHPEELWYCDDALELTDALQNTKQAIKCSKSVFEKICYRATHAQLLAVFRQKRLELQSLHITDNPLIVVVQGVEKPGNLGAILRTCNALGADAVISCDAEVDMFNPNVIRNSLGAFFHLPFVESTISDAIHYLKEKKLEIIATHLRAAQAYTSVNYTGPSALIFGSEANGLPDEWMRNAATNIIIPMEGIVDSLNVSVSVAVVLAEAKRQRLGKKKAPK